MEALFTPKFHQDTRRGFDEATTRIVRKDKTTGKTRTEERRKYGAEVRRTFDFEHKLRVYWKQHQLHECKDMWLKIAQCSACNYEFSRAFVGEHLFNFYIDHFFVVCMTNLLLEGQLNLLSHYTDANHDELLREVILQYLNWVLVPERIANREPEMRSKGSSKKMLEKAHR